MGSQTDPPVATQPVTDEAKRLIREYAALHPDELARSMKPQLWAASALHGAFLVHSIGVGAGSLAKAFGVSASAVNVRSRELRKALHRSPPARRRNDAPVLDLWSSTAASAAQHAAGTAELGAAQRSGSPELDIAPRASGEPGIAAPGQNEPTMATPASGERSAFDASAAPLDDDRSPRRPAPAFTPVQGQYLAFIHYYTKLHRQPPSEADLQRYFRVSPPAVHDMVVRLHENGLISRVPGQPRTMRVLLPRQQLPDLA